VDEVIPPALVLTSSDGKVLVRVMNDGMVELGPGVPSDEAARAFWAKVTEFCAPLRCAKCLEIV